VNGLVYIYGGCNGAQNCGIPVWNPATVACSCSSYTNDLVVYDPSADTYTAGAPGPAPRYRHNACAWRDAIYFFGGRTLPDDVLITQVDVYNTTSRAWSTLGAPSNLPDGLGSDNR
jgi:hypothetical protein